MSEKSRVVQIVPQSPGSREGVGDYALILATGLRSAWGFETVFLTSGPAAEKEIAGFPVLRLDTEWKERFPDFKNIILHYVNYGYQDQGVPFDLARQLRQLHARAGAQLMTIFHELYASSPPWQSAFWLQPMQKLLAGRIARMSNACLVSSEVMRESLLKLVPGTHVLVHPVMSTLGQPSLELAQLRNRDPHRWVVLGGTHLIERSLHSLLGRRNAIPDSFKPNELFVLGGDDNSLVRAKLRNLVGIRIEYQPAIPAPAASEILSSCAFGWLDYFRLPDPPTAAILKSVSHAALCAHGVVPVFPRPGSTVAVKGDALPGPFFIGTTGSRVPSESERAGVSDQIYQWYRRHAASEHVVRGIAAALQNDDDGSNR
jgi:hypothetical protein